MKKVYICKNCGSVVAANDNAQVRCAKCGMMMTSAGLTDQEWLAMSDAQRRDVFARVNQPEPAVQPQAAPPVHTAPSLEVPVVKPHSPYKKESALFNNPGGKLCVIGKIVAGIGMVVSVIVGISSIVGAGCTAVTISRWTGMSSGVSTAFGAGVAAGVISMLLGCLMSWIWGLAIYSFGDLVRKTNEIAENTRK